MVFFSFNEIKKKETLIGLVLGQILSLLSTSIGFTTSELVRKVVKAFQNTSMTSVMLLDCWAIPCVLVLTWVFLKTRYSLMKISGVVVCILGVVMVVFSDVHVGDRSGGRDPVKGDFLVIAAATLYAISNTSEADRVELMSFVGLFGAIIGAIQISIFERDALTAIHWSTWATNGTAMFTLSLLTSDMWAVLIRIFAYHEKVDWLYYLAFATTAIGLIIYSVYSLFSIFLQLHYMFFTSEISILNPLCSLYVIVEVECTRMSGSASETVGENEDEKLEFCIIQMT
uniref:EamA domain-containing protein n=1 Tax=Brassica oleracea var. oleracea TaxID=109376 RepID=A0A0D3CUS0_BRAOL